MIPEALDEIPVGADEPVHGLDCNSSDTASRCKKKDAFVSKFLTPLHLLLFWTLVKIKIKH